MLLKIKIYLVGVLYCMGGLFMILFPPRNFFQSGAKMRTFSRASDSLVYNQYLDYEDVLAIAASITNNDSEVAKVVYLTPKSYENRSIVALELRSDKLSVKPGILIIGGLNGMAWGAANAILELAEFLLHDTNFQTPFFNDYDWYLIPMANPDGVHFTQNIRHLPEVNTSIWTQNQTLRNTTRPNLWHKNVFVEKSGAQCFGTNINRNFAFHWQDDVPKTPDSCSQYYPGQHPFSSAESEAIRKYISQFGDSIQLSIHLYASFIPKKEYILYPWRYSLRQPSNHKALQAIGEYAARQSRLSDGRLYEVHQSSNDARVAGTLSDYLSGVLGSELVYLIKPYHEPFPNYTDSSVLETYVKKALTTTINLVRGWRRNTKQNTLSFFGTDVEF